MSRSLLAALLIQAGAALAQANVEASGLALQGYDPVAYFTEHKPVRGNPELTASHEGAIYRFASPAHREAFLAVEGKLYLNYSQSVRRRWASDIPGYVRKADANWPAVRAK